MNEVDRIADCIDLFLRPLSRESDDRFRLLLVHERGYHFGPVHHQILSGKKQKREPVLKERVEPERIPPDNALAARDPLLDEDAMIRVIVGVLMRHPDSVVFSPAPKPR